MPTSPSRFDRSALPPAAVFFRANVQRFRARGRRGTGLCPFHKDRTPSLSVDVEKGLFHCFTCGVGGDIITFVMLRDDVDFKRAAQSLGAWRDVSPQQRREIKQAQRKREQIDNKIDSIEQAERDLRLQYRAEIHKLEHEKKYFSQLREAIAGYYLLSFGTVSERIEFVLHPEKRAAAIDAVLDRGSVRDDEGWVMEVDFSITRPEEEVCGL